MSVGIRAPSPRRSISSAVSAGHGAWGKGCQLKHSKYDLKCNKYNEKHAVLGAYFYQRLYAVYLEFKRNWASRVFHLLISAPFPGDLMLACAQPLQGDLPFVLPAL